MAEAGGKPPKSDVSRNRGRRRRRLGIALVAVSVVLLVAVGLAAGLYLSFSAKVHNANAKMDPDIQRALETPPPTTLVTVPQASGGSGSADPEQDTVMNMLVLGTDARAGVVESPGSSDVIMLLHIDPKLDYFSILSVPRDLYLDLPGYGMDRVNAAYYRGGPALTIATLKQALGVDVTKYVGVGFESFPGLIDSLGGVYIDVDRQYTDTPYWKIDLSPGYQLLDGANALLYTRYRFDENADFGRMYRQQRILASVRDQARGWDKKLKLPSMVNTVMDSATTNLSVNEMLKLAYWLVKLDGARIKQIIIKGPGKTIDGKAVVVVDQATLAQAVTDFLTPPPNETTEAGTADAAPESGPLMVAAGNDAARLALAAPVAVPTTTSTAPALPALLDAAVWQAAQKSVPFALEAPTFVPEGFAYAYKMPAGDGTYGIKVGDGTKPAVRVGYQYEKSDLYLGLSATTWTGAPLASDGMAVESNGVVYTVVGTLGKPDHVWWVRDGVLYWVSNTLMYTLGDQDLLKIAESMQPVSGAAQ
jgi:polyisoprenyl-teichoic acid--peptidoglycan teichoic acid transferase